MAIINCMCWQDEKKMVFLPTNKNTIYIMAIDDLDKGMELFRRTFPKRLINARKIKGLSQAQLAEKLGNIVSSTSIEKYENGIMIPQSTDIIVKLANALGIPAGDFFREFRVNVDCGKFEFRKKSRLGKKKQESIVLKIKDRIEKYIEVEQIMQFEPHFDVDLSDIIVDSDDKAREVAMRLRSEWHLGLGPIPQPIQVLEAHGVKVIEVNEDPTLLDGTSNTIDGIPVVVINMNNKNPENPDVERRRFTLFHETGHQVMNIPSEIDDKTKEHLCDVFANEMLIPKQTFIKIFGEKRQTILLGELKNVQKEYGISIRALMMKAKQLNVISESRHKWFCINVNKDEKLKAFVDKNEYTEVHSTRFEQLVYRALAMEEITISKAASLLNKSVGELRNDPNFA